jgi:hypothetical protein
MKLNFKVSALLLFAVIKAVVRKVFRTGYYPKQWPVKLAIITGFTEALFSFIPEFTIEEVLLPETR